MTAPEPGPLPRSRSAPARAACGAPTPAQGHADLGSGTQRGMVLLVSLGLLLSLTLAAVSAAQTTVLELRMARNGRDAALAFHAAEAALADAERAIVTGVVSAVPPPAFGEVPRWQTHHWPDSQSAYLVEAVATVGASPSGIVAVFRITARGRGPGSAEAWLQTTYGRATAPDADARLTGRLSWVTLPWTW